MLIKMTRGAFGNHALYWEIGRCRTIIKICKHLISFNLKFAAPYFNFSIHVLFYWKHELLTNNYTLFKNNSVERIH